MININACTHAAFTAHLIVLFAENAQPACVSFS